MRWTVLALVVLLALGSATPVAASPALSTQQRADGYDGTHVSFETTGNAVVDYSVDGTTVVESVRVQSRSEAESGLDVGVGVDLSAVTGLVGASLSLDASATTDVGATVTADSGAEIRAHDNANGILVVDAGGEESQYVNVRVSASAETTAESDDRVTVDTGGTTGTFVVVGDGSVAVNDAGNLSADLASDAKLVFRSYADGRDEGDRKQEQLIADGRVAAEVHVMQEGGGAVVDTVRYSEDTTVEVTRKTEGAVGLTADRATSEGTVIVTSVSDALLDASGDIEVTVDGEAAPRASSYADLESAASGGATSKFLVRDGASARGTADVLVAVNHFSERDIQIRDGDSSDDGNSGGPEDSDGSSPPSSAIPGFGALAALLALAGLLAATRRS